MHSTVEGGDLGVFTATRFNKTQPQVNTDVLNTDWWKMSRVIMDQRGFQVYHYRKRGSLQE